MTAMTFVRTGRTVRWVWVSRLRERARFVMRDSRVAVREACREVLPDRGRSLRCGLVRACALASRKPHAV